MLAPFAEASRSRNGSACPTTEASLAGPTWTCSDNEPGAYTSSMTTQLIVELDEPLAQALERVAPARSRSRSAFVRAALRRALDELAEARMAEAYKAQPDVEPAHFDPRVWEPPAPVKRRSVSRRGR